MACANYSLQSYFFQKEFFSELIVFKHINMDFTIFFNVILSDLSKLYIVVNIVTQTSGFANFIDEWSQFDFCFTNFGVILEYLESSIRLSSTWSWHVYTIVRDTRSSCAVC